MSRPEFSDQISTLVALIGERQVDDALAGYLNQAAGPDSALFRDIERLCRLGVEQGWLCQREAGGIRYGRVIKPGQEAGAYSVDVVSMSDCRGPYHAHPRGEIDMVMPVDPGARFDDHPAGWVVKPPGSAHFPTVTGGTALVLYLLPGGEIDFTAEA